MANTMSLFEGRDLHCEAVANISYDIIDYYSLINELSESKCWLNEGDITETYVTFIEPLNFVEKSFLV